MLKIMVIGIYRILASLVIALPITINYLLDGGIVMSFITIPMLCLFLGFIAIWVDEQIIDALNYINLNNTSDTHSSNENTHSALNNKQEGANSSNSPTSSSSNTSVSALY